MTVNGFAGAGVKVGGSGSKHDKASITEMKALPCDTPKFILQFFVAEKLSFG
jgi:hypothetical protein